MGKTIIIGLLIILAIALVILVIKKFKIIWDVLDNIVDDTLKKEEGGKLKWSRTSLTMAVSFFLSIYMALWDMYKNGFNHEIFWAFLGVGVGIKLVDAASRKMTNVATPPNQDTPPTK